MSLVGVFLLSGRGLCERSSLVRTSVPSVCEPSALVFLYTCRGIDRSSTTRIKGRLNPITHDKSYRHHIRYQESSFATYVLKISISHDQSITSILFISPSLLLICEKLFLKSLKFEYDKSRFVLYLTFPLKIWRTNKLLGLCLSFCLTASVRVNLTGTSLHKLELLLTLSFVA